MDKQYQEMTELEEKINEKKTANAETGMMGFYKNMLTKNKAVIGETRESVQHGAQDE